MAARSYPDDVLALMPDSDLDHAGVEPFIADASVWVDNYLEGECPGLATSKLAIVERYLAAHLATLATEGPELVQAARADISERYAALKDGQATRYIATAAAFEPCGIVAEHWMGGRRMKARIGEGYHKDGGS